MSTNSELTAVKRQWYLRDEEDLTEVVDGQSKRPKVFLNEDQEQACLVDEASHK